MKRKIALFASLVFVLVCVLAVSISAACAPEHDSKWTVTFGENGYLGAINAKHECATCGTTTEEIPALFETLGYSYGPSGITQHYAANREAIARYEALTGEKIRFGAVAATRNHIAGNPLDENGNPVSDKVQTADLTDTKYDIFDIIVNNIPEQYMDGTGIICCAYIMAGKEITYIENGVERINAAANTYKEVTEKVDNKEVEKPEIDEYQIIDGTKYRRLSIEDLGLTQWAYWFSSSGSNWTEIFEGTGGTYAKYFATRKFTKDEIPNGTIIKVLNGWYYRPEGWQNGQKNDGYNGRPSRPGEVKTQTVVVDDDWWAKFDTRAFNITKGSAIASTVTAEDIYGIFMMYVPVSYSEVVAPPVGGEDPDEPVDPDPEQPVDPDPEEPVEPDYPTVDTEKQDWNADGALKILCIGNSFSVDSMEYVYQVAQAAGVKNIVLGNLYIGGCSLATHLANAQGDKGSYIYYTNTNGTWASSSGKKIAATVQSDDWDFISVQQVSGYSGIADSYSDLDALLDIVEPLNPSARLVWHMTWAYKTGSGHADFSKYDKNQMTMYNAIVSAVQAKVLTDSRIEIVIPAGTAIQNARTSYIGDNFTRDGYHLNDYGRFIGSLTFVKALTGLSIDKITYKLDSMTDNNLLVAIDAVNKAVASPYAVTTSAYTTEPEIEVPDTPEGEIPEGYRQLTLEEMGWQSCSFWNRSSFDYNTGKDFNKSYYGTVNSFTIDEIPIGSIIILKQGECWQYRPDGWGGSGGRPGNVTAERIVVNESWWAGYNTRGFNLSKTTGEKINSYTPEQIYEVLKIYVPITPVEEEQVTSSVTSDMCVSEVTLIDGTEYRALTAEAMGLTPFSYYWSENAEGLYLGDQEMAKKFFATGEFDNTVLVEGTVIWVESGWQYRPEGWTYTGSRPNNVTSTYITVDKSWWGTYSKRAFNISKVGMAELAPLGYDTVEEIYEIFKIYIPVEHIAE